jgi:hypothetical protein
MKMNLISFAILTIAVVTSSAVVTGTDIAALAGGCYDVGYEDGRNGPFERDAFTDNCGSTKNLEDNRYYQGFIDGCMSVEGNTKDICETATDTS